MSRRTEHVRPFGPDGYVHVFEIHPDWKHGKCRKCGQLWWVHKTVQIGVEPAETCCPDCNPYYEPNWGLDVEVPL